MAIIPTSALLFPLVVVILFKFSNGYESRDEGFTIELIHWDSPQSPFYNPLESDSDRMRNAFHRSVSRIHHLTRSRSEPTTPVVPYGSGYLTKFSIGTPPVENLVIVDTGSPLTWIQCKPCKKCYKQDPPVFDPIKSSSFKKITPCTSGFCSNTAPGYVGCLRDNSTKVCSYLITYGDKSFSRGEMATDTFTFSSSKHVVVPKLAFGCGHINGGVGFEGNITGLWGLSNNGFNLVTQMGFTKFSYCFTPFTGNDISRLKVGNHAKIYGKSIVSTPFTTNSTIYYVTLTYVSLGDKKIGKPLNKKGNMYVDSGTTLTTLPPSIGAVLETELRKTIKASPIKDPNRQYNLCYKKKLNVKVPTITLHFEGGDVRLPKSNSFIGDDEVECLGIVPADAEGDGLVFGCLAQFNFAVEYDLKAKKISFARADCTKF